MNLDVYRHLDWEILNDGAQPLIKRIRREWVKMLTQRLPEEAYQSYLHNHAGLFFDTRERPVVISKLRLGADFTTDFVLAEDRRSDGVVFRLIELETPWAPPFTSRGNPTARLSAAIQQIQNWRRWFLDNRAEALRLFPAFRVRAFRDPTFEFVIFIGNRRNSLKWLQRRHDLGKELHIGIRSFDLFTDIFDRQLFFEYETFGSGEGESLDALSSNMLASPFYCAYTDRSWRQVVRDPMHLTHFIAMNADVLLRHRTYSFRLEEFRRYCEPKKRTKFNL